MSARSRGDIRSFYTPCRLSLHVFGDSSSGEVRKVKPLPTCCSAILPAAPLGSSFPLRAGSRSTWRTSSSFTCTRLCRVLVISTRSPGSAWLALTHSAGSLRFAERYAGCTFPAARQLIRRAPDCKTEITAWRIAAWLNFVSQAAHLPHLGFVHCGQRRLSLQAAISPDAPNRLVTASVLSTTP